MFPPLAVCRDDRDRRKLPGFRDDRDRRENDRRREGSDSLSTHNADSWGEVRSGDVDVFLRHDVSPPA